MPAWPNNLKRFGHAGFFRLSRPAVPIACPAEVQQGGSAVPTNDQKRSTFPPAFPEVEDVRPLPEPTSAPAGSEAKLAELVSRAWLDLPLFHPDDSRRKVWGGAWDSAWDAPDDEEDGRSR
jgi:hypothetical protein